MKILELNFFDIHTHSADWALQIKVLKLKVFTHFSNSNFHFLHEMIVYLKRSTNPEFPPLWPTFSPLRSPPSPPPAEESVCQPYSRWANSCLCLCLIQQKKILASLAAGAGLKGAKVEVFFSRVYDIGLLSVSSWDLKWNIHLFQGESSPSETNIRHNFNKLFVISSASSPPLKEDLMSVR